MDLELIIGVGCTILGAVLGYVGFSRNKTKDDKSEGKQDGVILTELGYIKANTEEIKTEQKEQRSINQEVLTRLTTVEASAKQAHFRLDHLEDMERKR